LLLYKVVLAKGLNTPTAPPDPGGALLWGLFRRIETLYGLVPVAGKATVSNPSRTTGAVTGELGFSVPAGLPLGYSVTAEPTQGSLTIVGMGYYTYTPDAGSHGGTDSFTVSASSVWAATTSTITVPVMVPATTVPAGTTVTIGIDGQPNAVAFSPDGRRAYITSTGDAFTGDGAVSVVDTAANAVVATVGDGRIPGGVAVSPDGSTLYLAAPAKFPAITHASVVTVDTGTGNIGAAIDIGPDPRGMAISPDGSRAYVVDGGNGAAGKGTVAVVDTASKAVIATIGVGDDPSAVAVSPDGNKVFVVGLSGAMSVIDNEKNSTTTVKGVGREPAGIAVSPDGKHVYITDLFDGGVRVIDTATNLVSATILLGAVVGGVAVSPDGKHVYVADAQGSVAVIDAGTNTLAGAILVGGVPRQIYVLTTYDRSVMVIPAL
jgi:YVTN family beta-propeller protein